MTDSQLYLAVGIPMLFNGFLITIVWSALNSRMSRIEDRLDHVMGALADLDKRLTKVEIKLGMQP